MADVTGLDRVGVPVAIAVRPASPTFVTSSGKGLTPDASRASGVAEAMELSCAEDIDSSRAFRVAYEGLPDHLDRIPECLLPFARDPLYRSDWPVEWMTAWDMARDRLTAVPRSSVEMVPDAGRVRDLCAFQGTSNGLASGNNLAEALVSGLLEVIERDAAACASLRARHGGRPFPRGRLGTLEAPEVHRLLERIHAAGITVMLFDLTIDTDVPVCMAYVGDDQYDRLPVFKGYGAHLSPAIAIARAITEALQGRLVFISGSREDVYDRSVWQARYLGTRSSFQALLRQPETVDFDPVDASTSTFEGDLDVLIAKLATAGLDRVAALELTRPECPLAVVKVIVPGLEGHPWQLFEPGERARQMIGVAG